MFASDHRRAGGKRPEKAAKKTFALFRCPACNKDKYIPVAGGSRHADPKQVAEECSTN
jgi:hypothetical protein